MNHIISSIHGADTHTQQMIAVVLKITNFTHVRRDKKLPAPYIIHRFLPSSQKFRTIQPYSPLGTGLLDEYVEIQFFLLQPYCVNL